MVLCRAVRPSLLLSAGERRSVLGDRCSVGHFGAAVARVVAASGRNQAHQTRLCRACSRCHCLTDAAGANILSVPSRCDRLRLIMLRGRPVPFCSVPFSAVPSHPVRSNPIQSNPILSHHITSCVSCFPVTCHSAPLSRIPFHRLLPYSQLAPFRFSFRLVSASPVQPAHPSRPVPAPPGPGLVPPQRSYLGRISAPVGHTTVTRYRHSRWSEGGIIMQLLAEKGHCSL